MDQNDDEENIVESIEFDYPADSEPSFHGSDNESDHPQSQLGHLLPCLDQKHAQRDGNNLGARSPASASDNSYLGSDASSFRRRWASSQQFISDEEAKLYAPLSDSSCAMIYAGPGARPSEAPAPHSDSAMGKSAHSSEYNAEDSIGTSSGNGTNFDKSMSTFSKTPKAVKAARATKLCSPHKQNKKAANASKPTNDAGNSSFSWETHSTVEAEENSFSSLASNNKPEEMNEGSYQNDATKPKIKMAPMELLDEMYIKKEELQLENDYLRAELETSKESLKGRDKTAKRLADELIEAQHHGDETLQRLHDLTTSFEDNDGSVADLRKLVKEKGDKFIELQAGYQQLLDEVEDLKEKNMQD